MAPERQATCRADARVEKVPLQHAIVLHQSCRNHHGCIFRLHWFPRSQIRLQVPLRIPYGNKEVALKLGARYRSGGWYAPLGVDLSAFGERGWL